MNKNRIIVYVLVALLLSACGSRQDDTSSNIPTVKVDTAQLCGLGATQQYPGKVVSADDANISFKVAGTLQKVNVKEGQFVKKGQLLASLDPTDYKVQLKATQAEHAQIKAEAERVIGLYEDGGTTESNYDKARYGLEQINAKLEHHRNQLSYTNIYAPYDGRVQKVYMSKGETVGAGMPIVDMLSSGVPEVEINLPATAYVNRDHFTRFTCRFDVLPGEILEASPVSVLAQANANQLYTMRLKLNDKTKEITPGMSTWVTITSEGGSTSTVRIPSTCLLQEKDKTYVFIYHSQSKTVRQVEVDVQSLHTDGTVVVSGNISQSDLVVSSGVHHIKNGCKVNLLAPVSGSNVGGLM